MLFDGDCRFCKRWISKWKKLTGDAVDYLPYQEGIKLFSQVTLSECQYAVQLINVDGTVASAAKAVLLSLNYASKYPFLWKAYKHFLPFAWLCEAIYWLVARLRYGLSKMGI